MYCHSMRGIEKSAHLEWCVLSVAASPHTARDWAAPTQSATQEHPSMQSLFLLTVTGWSIFMEIHLPLNAHRP